MLTATVYRPDGSQYCRLTQSDPGPEGEKAVRTLAEHCRQPGYRIVYKRSKSKAKEVCHARAYEKTG